MTTAEFKKVGRLLKEAYAELEKEALAEGVDIFGDEYASMRDEIRYAILAKLGFTIEEYRIAKEAVAPANKISTDEKIVALQATQEEQAAKIPTLEEVRQIADEVAKSYIKPPQIINQIVKETVIEKPTVVKETINQTVNVPFDPNLLYSEIGYLNNRIDGIKIPPPFDNKAFMEAIKSDMKLDFGVMFKKNIDILGMPDFRKLAMGLQGQIDDLNRGVGDVKQIVAGTGVTISPVGGQGIVTINTTPFTSPLTTKGDIFGYSTSNDRIPVGANNTFLQADSSQALGVKYFDLFGTANTWTAKQTIQLVTEQIRIGYDGSNYYSATVGSTGGVTFDAVGSGAKFTFSDDLETTKNFLLPTTSSTIGQIKVNGTTIFHAYGTDNLFFGRGAGNFTQTGNGLNVTFGLNTGKSITTGEQNLLFGQHSGENITTASGCVCMGAYAGYGITTGGNNFALGAGAMQFSLQAMDTNTAIGNAALLFVGGSNNTALGYASGQAAVYNYFCTFLGYLADMDSSTVSFNGAYSSAIGAKAIVKGNNMMALGGIVGSGFEEDVVVGAKLTNNARFQIYNNLATKTGFIINGFTSQSASLQEWQDVSNGVLASINFAGRGTFTGLTVTSGEKHKVRVVTAAGAVTVATTDYIVVVNKGTGAATTINLPASPATGDTYIIKDGKGDAGANNITITPAAGNIDGAGTFVMNVNYQSAEIVYNGTQWNIT